MGGENEASKHARLNFRAKVWELIRRADDLRDLEIAERMLDALGLGGPAVTLARRGEAKLIKRDLEAGINDLFDATCTAARGERG